MREIVFENLVMELREVVHNLFGSDTAGHDAYHPERVFSMAMRIQSAEGGNKYVIACAAFLHDVHRLIQEKKRAYVEPRDSLSEVERVLRQLHTSEVKENMGKILHCVEFHEAESPLPAGLEKCKELTIIQDADMLDMLGALGIARGFQFAGAHGYPLWVPEEPINGQTGENGRDCSEVHHFYRHTLSFPERMNTETARAIAGKRCKAMKSFLNEFFKEWCGEA